MGQDLWVSKSTGERRKGTGFLDFKKIFTDKITAQVIYEALVSCSAQSNASDARQALTERDFDSAGVVDVQENIIGFVMTNSLIDGQVKDYLIEIKRDRIISDSTPLFEIFNVLKNNDFVYVNYIDKVVGILSKADLNKPPVRIYIFGLISLFEMHLSYWIKHYFPDDSWQSVLSKGRLKILEGVFAKRRENGMNQQLTIKECLQIYDKKNILLNNQKFIDFFDCSKKKFKKSMESIESIRNNIAHAQNSILEGSNIEIMSDALNFCEHFLIRSDDAVLELAKN